MPSGPTATGIYFTSRPVPLLNQYNLLNFLLRPDHAYGCTPLRAPSRASRLNILDNNIRRLAPQLNIIVRELA